MDRNEIQKAIQELEDMAYHPSLKKELSASCLALAISALEQQRWKTIDELPEQDMPLIVKTNKGTVLAAYWDSSNEYFDNINIEYDPIDEYTVLYWQHMPD